MPTLQQKIKHLIAYSSLLFFLMGCSVQAAQANAQSSGYSLDDRGDANYLFVALCAVAGGFVAALVPTAIDSQMRYSPSLSKGIIGFFFGFLLCWTADRHYENLTALDFLFPAFVAAAIGAPVMVYLINIANDPQTWVAVINWVKRRFGIDTPPSGS